MPFGRSENPMSYALMIVRCRSPYIRFDGNRGYNKDFLRWFRRLVLPLLGPYDEELSTPSHVIFWLLRHNNKRIEFNVPV